MAAELLRRGGDHDGAIEAASAAARGLARASILDRADAALASLERWIAEDGHDEGSVQFGFYLRALAMKDYFTLKYPQARERLVRARALFAKHGDRPTVNALAFEISSTYLYEDDFATCEQWVAATLAEPDLDLPVLQRARHRMAELASLRRDLPKAIALQQAAVETLDEADEPHHILVVLGTLADLLAITGDVDAAQRTHDRSRELVRERSDRFMHLDLARTTALIDLARGRWHAAREHIQPRVASLLARHDQWHLTGDRAIVAVIGAAIDPDEAAEEAVRAFMTDYRAVKHDEPATWWCIRVAEALLRGRGMPRIASELGALLDQRLADIDAAFALAPSRLP